MSDFDELKPHLVDDGKTVALTCALTCMVLVFGFPLAFWWFKGEQLRMSDDYAAISSAVSGALLLIGAVEIAVAQGRIKGLLLRRASEVEERGQILNRGLGPSSAGAAPAVT
ncbi:hypothetical protein [Streptomyces thermospinosisporus]|uniref:hypothetical protein n=1 Tax=Streptomyces thermospinosisporus TaxID=161482 RepID=UPI0031D1BC5F